MTDQNAVRVAALMAEYPEFEVWTVHRATGRGPHWCARRWGAEVAQFQEESAEELGRRLAEAQRPPRFLPHTQS